MKKIIGILVVLMAFVLDGTAQMYRNEPAFKDGEYAKYNVYYNWGFIWIHAGDVEFSVKEKKINGQSYYELKLSGFTIKSFDHLYTIRDTFVSVVTKTELMPYYYREVKHEDSYFCDRKYSFSHEKDNSKIYWQLNRKGKLSSDTMEIEKSVFDLLTTCYRFRSLDVAKVKENSVIPFDMVFDEEIYSLGMRYKGKETIKMHGTKDKYQALKFVPKLITGDLFKNEDDMAIYVSADDNHVPLYIEAKIKVGAVKVMLETVKNTKYPMSSMK